MVWLSQYRQILGSILMSLLAVAAIVWLVNTAPIAQNPSYHNFSDVLPIANVPNALNVWSNIPFMIVGVIGLLMLQQGQLHLAAPQKTAAFILCIGTVLVGFGSAYYHLSPNNITLVWDRLPMTLAFMALYSLIIGEYLNPQWGRRLLWPLLFIGFASVLYWAHTEAQGLGDLRFYALVQFFPLLSLPILLLAFKSPYASNKGYWWLIASYLLAKLFEHYDASIHAFLGVVSGHSLKHLMPALGFAALLIHWKNRRLKTV